MFWDQIAMKHKENQCFETIFRYFIFFLAGRLFQVHNETFANFASFSLFAHFVLILHYEFVLLFFLPGRPFQVHNDTFFPNRGFLYRVLIVHQRVYTTKKLNLVDGHLSPERRRRGGNRPKIEKTTVKISKITQKHHFLW